MIRGRGHKSWSIFKIKFLHELFNCETACGLEQGNCVGRGGDQPGMVQGRRSQEEAVSPRLFGIFTQRLEVPQLANRHAKLVEKPRVEH
jgi:hypothetical protein